MADLLEENPPGLRPTPFTKGGAMPPKSPRGGLLRN